MPVKKPVRPKRYQVPALKRAFGILDSLNESSFGLTVQEVSRIHKIPYSTVFYLLETMLGCGYVQRNGDSKKYTLGHKLFAFRDGSVAKNTLNLRALAFPLLQELTDVTGLTVHIAILNKNEAVYIEKTESNGFIRLNTWVGERKCLHCTGVGKALLMSRPDEEIRNLATPESMIRRTERTITSVDVLLENLAKCRESGYALDDAEDEAKGRGVAAPIFDSEGKVIASVGFAGTLAQIDLHRIDALGKAIKNYAGQISRRLGHTGVAGRSLKLVQNL